jgi:lysophospholipase L1-like esterase
MSRITLTVGALGLAAALGACATTAPTGPTGGGSWIESWGTAVAPPTPAGGRFPPSPSFHDQTIRQVVRLSAGGDSVRVRFSNEYGQAPLAVGAARVALVDDKGGFVPGTEHALTFGGGASATIPPGAPLVSDPVAMPVANLAKLSISLYLPGDTGPCTCHQVGLESAFVSGPGDHTAGVFEPVQTTQFRAFLSGVEVRPKGRGETVVAFGDSITDGVGSTMGANKRWPDQLAERLLTRKDGVAWGVANAGISGNRVLAPGAGEAALARFDRDVLGRPGVRYVIVFEGVNDLGIGFGNFTFGPPRAPTPPAAPTARRAPTPPPAPPTPPAPALHASDVIAGYQQLIARAHAHGVEIIGATIAPYEGAAYWSAKGEAARQEINTWIRTSGAFDGVLDFDAAFRDPAHPTQMADGLHAGDHLHGSDAGYKKVADSIALSLFK